MSELKFHIFIECLLGYDLVLTKCNFAITNYIFFHSALCLKYDGSYAKVHLVASVRISYYNLWYILDFFEMYNSNTDGAIIAINKH